MSDPPHNPTVVESVYKGVCSFVTFVTRPTTYNIRSTFLRHCVAYNIVELSYHQAEILEATGYDTHFVCRSLSDDFGIIRLRRELANVYTNLNFVNQNVPEKDYEFDFLTIKKYKAIGKYAQSKDSYYFSQMDENGMVLPKTTSPNHKGQVLKKL